LYSSFYYDNAGPLRHALLFFALVQTLAGLGGHALAEEPPQQPGSRPEIRVPMTPEAPLIDGALNDPAWTHAAVIKGLGPALAADAGQTAAARPTTIRLLWDAEHLYVALTARDDEIFGSGKLKRDDPLYTEDAFEIFLDPVGDGRMMIETQINPFNQIFDNLILLTAEPVSEANGVLLKEMRQRNRWDAPEWNWPSIRHGTGRLIEDGKVVGWTAEIAFSAWPLLKRLGLRRFEPMSLRANIIRLDWLVQEGAEKRLMVQTSWSSVLRGHAHISPAAMGTLILEPPAPVKP